MQMKKKELLPFFRQKAWFQLSVFSGEMPIILNRSGKFRRGTKRNDHGIGKSGSFSVIRVSAWKCSM
jgi:hypothetical protein